MQFSPWFGLVQVGCLLFDFDIFISLHSPPLRKRRSHVLRARYFVDSHWCDMCIVVARPHDKRSLPQPLGRLHNSLDTISATSVSLEATPGSPLRLTLPSEQRPNSWLGAFIIALWQLQHLFPRRTLPSEREDTPSITNGSSSAHTHYSHFSSHKVMTFYL